jgi:hypothetical protein
MGIVLRLAVLIIMIGAAMHPRKPPTSAMGILKQIERYLELYKEHSRPEIAVQTVNAGKPGRVPHIMVAFISGEIIGSVKFRVESCSHAIVNAHEKRNVVGFAAPKPVYRCFIPFVKRKISRDVESHVSVDGRHHVPFRTHRERSPAIRLGSSIYLNDNPRHHFPVDRFLTVQFYHSERQIRTSRLNH